ncbi:KinB-signaling pathway activation protein [Shimazuella sp. AN120528]|uniref:KinB-signaling pathway activation protein n=1 Tax=Shimazuella soli TaxID=1892854 RepID=UPI001F0D1F0C|nr:KinB-signaling pathway activation protein [Shimazuella soli]MCH5586001.1 KinB-signaling pathway activation protein [Shimazuella soli]
MFLVAVLIHMTLKKLFFWIVSTLIVGAVLSIVLVYGIRAVTGTNLGEFTQILLTGLTFAAVAELGFFSYLVFNWLAKGFLRNPKLFSSIQIFLILILLFNLIYLNTSKFAGSSLTAHLVVPLVILLVSLAVAWWKSAKSVAGAFVPTLFFMVAATTLEAIPSINSKAGEVPLPFVVFTVLILLVCNSYQILQLSWLVTRSQKNNETVRKRSDS